MAEKLKAYEELLLKLFRAEPEPSVFPTVTLEFNNFEDLCEFTEKTLPIQHGGYEVVFEDQLDADDYLKVIVKFQKIGAEG